MSIRALQTQDSKALGFHQANANPSQNHSTKALGLGGNAELGAWLEQANQNYSAVMNGSEPQPDPTAWQQFLSYLQWAQQQMNNPSEAWDPMAGQNDPLGGTGAQEGDPFGGQTGTNGNTVYTDPQAKVGFVGAGNFDVYSFDFTLDVAPTSAQVTIEKTTDTRIQPAEDVIKITVLDKATGAEAVYFLHNISDINSIQVNTPNGLHVTDLTGDSRVQIGEFVEGAAGQGGGIPENAQIDGDNATYDGVAGQVLDFSPPFGGIPNHTIYSDVNISGRNSDLFLVEKTGDGYRVTVTDLEGKKTVFTVPEGFKLNINAHAPNVTFKEGTGTPHRLSGSNDLTLGGPSTGEAEESDESNTVPEGWENLTLNGEGAPVEETDPEEELPSQLLDLLDALGIDPNDPGFHVSKSILDEIKAGIKPPSNALLDLLLKNDTTLKQAWNKAKDNPNDEHAMAQVRDRLANLLSLLYDGGVGKTGDYPEGVEPDALLESRTIFFDDFAYEITEGFGLERIADSSETEGEDGEVNQEKQEALEAIAQQLADLPGIYTSPEDILAKAEEYGIDLLSLPSNPFEEPGLIAFLATVDEKFKQVILDYNNSPKDGTAADNAARALRDRVIDLFGLLYPNAGVGVGDDNDDMMWYGAGEDIGAQGNKGKIDPNDPETYYQLFRMGNDG